ncbi:hypothetical protein [Streptomyces sp. NPDC059176]|uniref:hypothetical protein n=1 Tax=Streptomyces sp. NPDC059176 TaxID=3346758 RepID=UPI0036A9C3DD
MEIARIVALLVVFGISFLYYRRVTKPSGSAPTPGAAEKLGLLPQSRQNALLASRRPELDAGLRQVPEHFG